MHSINLHLRRARDSQLAVSKLAPTSHACHEGSLRKVWLSFVTSYWRLVRGNPGCPAHVERPCERVSLFRYITKCQYLPRRGRERMRYRSRRLPGVVMLAMSTALADVNWRRNVAASHTSRMVVAPAARVTRSGAIKATVSWRARASCHKRVACPFACDRLHSIAWVLT